MKSYPWAIQNYKYPKLPNRKRLSYNAQAFF